jgi:hypothetical protein
MGIVIAVKVEAVRCIRRFSTVQAYATSIAGQSRHAPRSLIRSKMVVSRLSSSNLPFFFLSELALHFAVDALAIEACLEAAVA